MARGDNLLRFCDALDRHANSIFIFMFRQVVGVCNFYPISVFYACNRCHAKPPTSNTV